jgi:2-polyprenyl-3-methyl-5-hydroxy-6-metoxy-1,4-benzoquinol methylase/tetratricopeptide (TPR) repeat protein
LRPGDVLSIQRSLETGMQHHDAGRLAQAEASYQEVLRAHPGHPDALALLADIAHRTGHLAEAVARLREAIRQRSSVAPLQHKLGLVLADAGELDAAIAAQRAAVRLKADYADAWFQLGNLLALQRRHAEAIPAYRRAVVAQPRFAAAHNNLALALEAEGRWDEALVAYRTALAVEDARDIRANVARYLTSAPRVPADAATRELVARAVAQAWLRPADLARLAAGLVCVHPGLSPAIQRAQEPWPADVAASGLLTPDVVRICNAEPLVGALLTHAQASDRALERFLECARRALLELVGDDAGLARASEALPFACALARQCFLNDYVFSTTPGEEARVERLQRDVGDAIEAGTLSPASLAVLACYVPLGAVRGIAAARAHPWPEPLRALLVQQVDEPAQEAREREALASLTPITAKVSRQVRDQYEENPYPRWTRLPDAAPLPLDLYLRVLFPAAMLPPRGTIADRDILVAGCGTGQESLDLAHQFPASRILAVDLSRASLGYAARKTREAGVRNVEHAQADLVELASCGRTFDLISCMGVLHHLADPMAGWKALASVLRPGGFMQVGLYSERARRAISAARAMIALEGFTPSAADIRRCRGRMLADPAWDGVTQLRDFHGLNECRDLLFHVQEHTTSWPRVGEAVAQAGLRFVGVAAPPPLAHAFAQRFPAASPADLACWDELESENPDAFAGMYLFWVQKPAA